MWSSEKKKIYISYEHSTECMTVYKIRKKGCVGIKFVIGIDKWMMSAD